MSEWPEISADAEAIRAGARALGEVGAALDAAQRSVADAAVVGAAAWTGPRSLDARFAAHGVGGQLGVAARCVADLSAVLERLAGAADTAAWTVDAARADVRRAEAVVPADPDHVQRVRRRAWQEADAAAADYRRAARDAAAEVGRVSARAVRQTNAADLDALGARRVASAGVVAAAWRVLGDWVAPDCGQLPSRSDVAAAMSGGPVAASAWWRALSPGAQLAALRAFPGLLGDLDGLPGWARDIANREVLGQLRHDLAAQLDNLRGLVRSLSPGLAGYVLPAMLPSSRGLADKLRALAALAAVVAVPGRQLLSLDARGKRVTAAVAVGDVDTADDVAVLTPGFTSNVADSIADYVADASGVRAAMDLLNRGVAQTGAVVAWLGYEAPQVGELLDGYRTVALPIQARIGAVALAAFLRGIDANRVDGVHLTALGHSYGSTTTGLALARQRTGVDDVVLFGSPGSGTLLPGALHVPRGHLWDLNAPFDIVGGVSVFGLSPAHLPWFHHLETGPTGVSAGVSGHTSYLVPGTTSQMNIAAVSAGAYDDVVTDQMDGFPAPF